MVKVPQRPDPGRLTAAGVAEVGLAPHSVLWRVHDTAAAHARPWNTLRHYGPLSESRFDPHEPPPRRQTEGVTYAALDISTALAERFQKRRMIERAPGAPYLVGFRPLRTLRLLDLMDTWPIRAGASHALNTGDRSTCRAWAVAIRAAWPRLDGLWYSSSMTGRPCVTLWSPASDALPDGADVFAPLTHLGLDDLLQRSAVEIGYGLV